MIFLVGFLCLLNSVMLFVFLLFLHKKDKEHTKMIQDLLNRKVSRDFYDYVYGTKLIKDSKNKMETHNYDLFKNNDLIPPFINQTKPEPVGGVNFGG